jgi:hypothetical protein
LLAGVTSNADEGLPIADEFTLQIRSVDDPARIGPSLRRVLRLIARIGNLRLDMKAHGAAGESGAKLIEDVARRQLPRTCH